MNELNVLTAPKKARVEIIPLIDVVFFLLATFVLFTLSLQKNWVLEAELPKTAMEHNGPDEATLFVQASAAGTYHLKRGASGTPEMVSSAALRDKLIGYRNEVGSPRVFIRSDNTATMGDAVLVLDEVRRAGITQVAVETVVTKSGG